MDDDDELAEMDEASMKKMFKEKLEGLDKPDKMGKRMGGDEMKKMLGGKDKESFKKDLEGMGKDEMRAKFGEMKKKMGGKDMDGDFKKMKGMMDKKPTCADKTEPVCTDKSKPLDKKAIAMKMLGEVLCPADKKAPTCADKSEPEVTEEDKKSMEDPKPKCKDGKLPVCTGGVAALEKKDVLGKLMCEDRNAPTCPNGGKFVDSETDEGERRPKCDNEEKPTCTGGADPELPEILQGAMKMKKMMKKKTDNIDKAKFFCKDGKQPTCKAGKKLVWRMGGEQKQKKKFDPKKGGCRDMQKPTCEDGKAPTCLAGENEKKKCTDGQPRLCAEKKEPLCSDGSK